MVLGIDGSIYYAPASGARLSRIAIPETDATLSGIYLNGKLLTDFSPGKLKYNVAVSREQVVMVATTQGRATATIIRQGSAEQLIIIQVVGADGKSKLEYSITSCLEV